LIYVDLPAKDGDFPVRYVNVYQRVFDGKNLASVSGDDFQKTTTNPVTDATTHCRYLLEVVQFLRRNRPTIFVRWETMKRSIMVSKKWKNMVTNHKMRGRALSFKLSYCSYQTRVWQKWL